MDLARDLVDHQIVGTDGAEHGRVDDIWICPAAGEVGPIVTGTAALIPQLGWLGRIAAPAIRTIGTAGAWSWHEIPWADVARLERPQVVVLAWHPAEQDEGTLTGRPGSLLYSRLLRRAVIDDTGRRYDIIDVRATPPQPAPRIAGLIVAPHRRARIGMKRFDTSHSRFGGHHADTAFVPWGVVTLDDRVLHLGAQPRWLPIQDAPEADPPPMPASSG